MNNSLSLAREMKRAESLMRQKKYVEATETVKGVMVRFPNNKELQFAYKNLRVGIPFRGKNRLEVIKQKKSGLLEAFEAKD